MTRILIFGTGNIGSVYACILARAGAQMTCVCRSNHRQAKTHGFKISSSIFGELHASPAVVQSVEEALALSVSPFDFLVITTKATSNATSSTIDLIRPVLFSGKTSIVLIQNGLGVERPFHQAFPDTPIISGVVYLPTTQISSAVFVHSEMELLHLGLYPSSPHYIQEITDFARLIEAGGATVVLQKDIQTQRWSKIVANGAINPICALSRCRDRELMDSSPLAADLVKSVMLDIVAVAESAGYGNVITKEVAEKQFARSLARPFPGVQPSMMADALEARPLEVHAIIGELVRIARENEVQVPRLVMLYVLLEGLDKALQAERQEKPT